MSILDGWHNRRHDDDDSTYPESKDEQNAKISLAKTEPAGLSVEWVTPEELAAIADAHYSVSLQESPSAGAAIDSLIPLAANAAQAAHEYNMAVIKFPEGVGWAELCNRQRGVDDGWKLLANIKDGKFNDMAAIRRAGISPIGVANLALQMAAVAVGMSYMNEINKQLSALQTGVAEVLDQMQRERDATLKSALNTLQILATRQDEFLATPEKCALALQMAEDARHDADEAWNYQIMEIRELEGWLRSNKKPLDDRTIGKKIDSLLSSKARAAYAYRLIAMSECISMGIESDYSERKIESERCMAKRLTDEYEDVVDSVEANLLDRITQIEGSPLLIAGLEDDAYVALNPIDGAIHEAGRQINRLNPLCMMEAAKDDLSKRKTMLQGKLTAVDEVKRTADAYAGQLDDLDFAFNKANALLVNNGQVRAICMRDKGTEDQDNEHLQNAKP